MTDTIDSLLRDQAAAHGARDAVVDPAERISYAELNRSTGELGAAFVASGIGKGMRVGLLMPNGVAWARIALALMRIGAVVVPLSTLLTARELSAQLQTASVQHLIAVEEFRGHRYDLDATPPALRSVRTPEQVFALRGHPAAAEVAEAMSRGVRPADPLTVVFTSGSSGAPKGVRHSHGNAIGAVRSGLAARCVDADTRLYLPMPYFWIGGLGGGLLSALTAGATLVTEPVPQTDSTLRLLADERVTLFRGWPDQAEALARHLPASGVELTELRAGSLDALLPPRLRSRPGARARLFGMTESFGPYCGYPADTDMPETAWGSCGKPFDGMQVRIVGADTGEPAPTGAIGMIQIRGRHVMRGICRRSREEVFTSDGWYATGDLGHLDTDGFLYYHGRCDDMFKVRGATVYPSEVEQALRSLDGVSAAFVTNVAGPEGGRVGAAVVCDAPATAERLRSAAREVLSSFKVPTVWLLLDSQDRVPRGATGKVDMARLRALLEPS
ncbi:acyl--CoA ligase [Mycolicibacterium austroafricanum]|jgi:acyl-CoA synthetase (AMP-forming)/AMP-acid ligase II|uniref:Class I adenylate-forming enzyme family protein n=1 Tax=Mycolicibacterium austroafricanum TaxID=39687 RepID=A0ABT8HC95_MYCAO|nr:class I adenylate-forming enzyme family protein [Mycolicibacterium austroafricanum]MDN4518382.1 class I adenylate-forming enzyme family protein [Mycolicibacterium austroafricanum]QRZ08606.1 acyl--CoA ligase [Mycolicibacterium austroafricanum]QZT70256.1 acyl--CoA ligase [Mycolicibacterium austroafricanum]